MPTGGARSRARPEPARYALAFFMVGPNSSRRVLALALAAAGLLSLVLGAWASSQFRSVAKGAPFLDAPMSLAAGPDGTLFVGVDGKRVHAYSPRGDLLRAWQVETDGARFRVAVTAAGTLVVAPDEGRPRLTYDLEGTLLAKAPDPDAFRRIGPAHDARLEMPSGVHVELTTEGLVQTHPAPGGLLVRTRPWPLVLFGKTPLLGLTLSMLLGALVIMLGILATTTRAEVSR